MNDEGHDTRGVGSAYAFCTECKCVAIYDGKPGPHHWIERVADAMEQAPTGLSRMICNVCAPLPDLLCESCSKIACNVGAGYVWKQRAASPRELHRLPRRRCPGCVDTVLIRLLRGKLASAP